MFKFILVFEQCEKIPKQIMIQWRHILQPHNYLPVVLCSHIKIMIKIIATCFASLFR